jgi:hypothetical protein
VFFSHHQIFVVKSSSDFFAAGLFVLRPVRRVNMATALLFAVVPLVTVATGIGSDPQVFVLNVVQQHPVAVDFCLGGVGHITGGTGLPACGLVVDDPPVKLLPTLLLRGLKVGLYNG